MDVLMRYPQATERSAVALMQAPTMYFAIMRGLPSRHAFEIVSNWPARFVGDIDDDLRFSGAAVHALIDISPRALRETKGLPASAREPDRHRLGAPIHV